MPSNFVQVAIARASLHLYMKGALHDLLVLPSNDGSDGWKGRRMVDNIVMSSYLDLDMVFNPRACPKCV